MRIWIVPELTLVVLMFFLVITFQMASTAGEKNEAAGVNGATAKILFEDDFSKGADKWTFTDANAWEAQKEGENGVLALKARSKYKPAVRSPESIAWAKDLDVKSFVMDVCLKTTDTVGGGHQDMCLFFGRQDAEHFYYVHIAMKSDAHANSIFIVNGKPRVSIAKERTKGTAWDKGYHVARIVRDADTGVIEVYFDDMSKPIMKAEDKTFLSGPVGIGSFDNTGVFDYVRVWDRKP
ncbi:MAG TPA: hypothetical protein PL033_18890 [Candidatus Brocadiia bacterium]|nr:hypothetical protein [Candidatus Brocadiia bacterium]